jgi:hypothetical protein
MLSLASSIAYELDNIMNAEIAEPDSVTNVSAKEWPQKIGTPGILGMQDAL